MGALDDCKPGLYGQLEAYFKTRNKSLATVQKDMYMWLAFMAIVGVAYKFFSDGTFSAVLTLSSFFQTFAYCLLLVKINRTRSGACLSLKSLGIYAVSLLCRLYATCFFIGYLPVDKSGDWMYQAADAMSVVLVCVLMYQIYTYAKNAQNAYSGNDAAQYNAQNDNFPALYTAVGCLVLALICKPELNKHMPSDFSWTFANFLEAIGMLPQIFVLSKEREVETVTSHYVAAMAVSRLLSCVFWTASWAELRPEKNAWNIPGTAVVGAYVISCLVYGDFMYYYVKACRAGKRMVLPTNMV